MRENRKLQFRVQVIPGDRLLAWPRFSAPRRGAVNCVTLRPPPMRSWGPCPPLPDRGRLWSREGAEVRLDRLAAGASRWGLASTPSTPSLSCSAGAATWTSPGRPAGRGDARGPADRPPRRAERQFVSGTRGGPAPIGRTVPGAVPGARPLCSEPASRAGSSREGTPRRLSSSAAVTLGFQSQPHDGRLCEFRTSHITFHASASSSMT